MHQINFTANLFSVKYNDGEDINDKTTMFFIIEETKEVI